MPKITPRDKVVEEFRKEFKENERNLYGLSDVWTQRISDWFFDKLKDRDNQFRELVEKIQTDLYELRANIPLTHGRPARKQAKELLDDLGNLLKAIED